MPLHTVRLFRSFLFTLLIPATLVAAQPWESADLNPVRMKAAPNHASVALVQAGKPRSSIVVMGRPTGASSLQHFIKAATGAELPIVKDLPIGPAIVLGDCEQAAALGLDSAKMPPVWIEDAPVFRMRVMWPPMSQPRHGRGISLSGVQSFSRAGNSWPTRLKVHQPNWSPYEELKKNRPGF
jgi:hypothetical protein